MAAYVKYQNGVEALLEGVNSGTDTWRLILSNTAPDVAADITQADAAELGTAGGYAVNGVACSITSSTQAAGVFKLILAAPASPTWTASAGGFTFRYVILWNQTTDSLVAYWDYGSAVVMNGTNGDTFTPTLDAAGGTFTVT
jgi:hypothetical protein